MFIMNASSLSHFCSDHSLACKLLIMDDLIHDDEIDPAWVEDEAEGVARKKKNYYTLWEKKLFLRHMQNMVL